MTLLSIDPGTRDSAYVIVDAADRIVENLKTNNDALLSRITNHVTDNKYPNWENITALAIEMPAVAMMSGGEIFTTCLWVGRFVQAFVMYVSELDWQLVTRHQVKMHLLGRCSRLGKGADAAVRAALIALYGGPSSIKKGGALHGVTGDCWSALAVAHTATHGHRPRGHIDKAAEHKAAHIMFEPLPHQGGTR